MLEPVTQNHYLYAGSNPAMFVDYSGNNYSASEQASAMTIGGMLNGIAESNGVRIAMELIQKLPAISTAGVRGLARGASRDLVRYEWDVDTVELTYLLTIARLYARFGDHTEMDKIPIQVYGSNNLPEHQNHIFRSMIGQGSSRHSTKVLLHKGPRQSRYFLSKALCTEANMCRDEYPYNTTYEGGKENFKRGKVSVELVSARESGRQGSFIREFYKGADIGLTNAFFVFPFGGISGYFDKSWNWHQFPKN